MKNLPGHLPPRLLICLLASASLMACSRPASELPHVRTLEIHDGTEDVAHLVLEDHAVKELVCLVPTKCPAVQASLDALVAQEEATGDPHIERALTEHFGKDGFSIHPR